MPLSEGITDSTAAQNSSEITPVRVTAKSSPVNTFRFRRHALVADLMVDALDQAADRGDRRAALLHFVNRVGVEEADALRRALA